jgi:hypothetical protein
LDLLQKYENEVLDAPYLVQLYNPEFKQVDGLYFLSAHMHDESWSRWLENPEYVHSPHKLENTINHVHLDELIEDEEKQHEIGEFLKQRWFEILAREFPKQEFEIKVMRLKDGGWELQMWAKRDDNKKKLPK